MHKVDAVLVTKPDCTFCDEAKAILQRLSSEFPLSIRIVSLDTSEGQELALRHGLLFPPGILLDGKPFSYGRPSEGKLRQQLQALNDLPGAEDQPPIISASPIPQVER